MLLIYMYVAECTLNTCHPHTFPLPTLQCLYDVKRQNTCTLLGIHATTMHTQHKLGNEIKDQQSCQILSFHAGL